MSTERQRLYGLLGAGAAVWAGESGLRVKPGHWVAISGAPSADCNLALVHGANAAGAIRQTIAQIAAANVPAMIMLVGEALGDAQELVDGGWVCVGALPLMRKELVAGTPARGIAGTVARRLDVSELPAARSVVADAFGTPPEIAAVVLRDRATMTPGHSVWGLFDPDGRLVSCAVAAIVEDTLVGWWMATRPSERRRGYGGLLVNSLLADAAANGVRCALHHSSYVGEPTYRALGFEELERLQLWSRRRWFLSRA